MSISGNGDQAGRASSGGLPLVWRDGNAKEPSGALRAGAWDDGLGDGDPLARLQAICAAQGDLSGLLSAAELAALGARVVEDHALDDGARQEWLAAAEKALDAAAQVPKGEKNWPFRGSANVRYPVLTIAAQQFASRALPALLKGDQVAGTRALGAEPSPPPAGNVPPQPQPPPQGAAPPILQAYQKAMAQWQPQVAQQQQLAAAYQAALQGWALLQGRARRVGKWLNYKLFYGMPQGGGPDWEADFDQLLHVLPVVGCVVKKVRWDAERGVVSELVDARRLCVAAGAPSFERSPRVTQEFELYPYEVQRMQRDGTFRDDWVLPLEGGDGQAPRAFLEQHLLADLDGDGMDEPYVVTVDRGTMAVLRVEAAFTAADVRLEGGGTLADLAGAQQGGGQRQAELPSPQAGVQAQWPEAGERDDDEHAQYVSGLGGADGIGAVHDRIHGLAVSRPSSHFRTDAVNGDDLAGDIRGYADGQAYPQVVSITRWLPFAPYIFLPDVKGGPMGVGFGQLMADLTDTTDSILNMQLDAGGAQVAGGGFISSGLRLGGSGQSGALRFERGEYKVVSGVAGGALRDAIWERTLPGPSQALAQLLEMLLEAAKDISNVSPVSTGDIPSTAPVGTTLAVQNEALRTTSAILKRVWRALRRELGLIAEAEARWGQGADGKPPEAYGRITGGSDADWQGDFEVGVVGGSVVPVADPAIVTMQQGMARAQVGVGIAGQTWAEKAGLNFQEIARRSFEAAQEDDIDKLFMPPAAPDPLAAAAAAAHVAGEQAKVGLTRAQTELALANAGQAGAAAEHQRGLALDAVATRPARTLEAHAKAIGGVADAAGAIRVADPSDAAGGPGMGPPEAGDDAGGNGAGDDGQ